MLLEFDIAKLKQLDGGRVFEAMSQAIERAVSDCDDRPGVNTARVVSLKCHISPCLDEKGFMESVNVAFSVTESKPSRKSEKYNMASRRMGGKMKLLFNDLSVDNVKQMTIDQVE